MILLSFEAGFMSVSFLSIRLKRITQTPLQTTFYSTQGAEAIPQYRPLLLIWNFDSNLCAASHFRISYNKLHAMLLDNAACDIKSHTKVHIRSTAFVAHEKLFLCMM